jgi:hypothetical protein
MHLGGPNNFVSVECAAACDGADDVLMCSGDPNVCMGGQACLDSTWLGTGYQWCG